MGYVSEMTENVCRSILNKLQSSGIETRQLAFQEMLDRNVGALQRPAINISVNSARFQKITLYDYRCFLELTLYLMASDLNLNGEEKRRFIIHNLIEGITDSLFLKKLGLELQDPITPMSFANVTDERFSSAGYIIYELKFSTSFNFEKDASNSDEMSDDGVINSIVTDFYLQDPSDDGISDSTSSLTLDGVYGGTPFTEDLDPIYGGAPGSADFSDRVIYGGTPFN